MKEGILSDENIHAGIVQWLRDRGEDVVYAAEEHSARTDEWLLHRAETEQRVLLTDDKDFGELVYKKRLNSFGVIPIRLGSASIRERLHRLAAVWSTVQQHQPGAFIVLGYKRVRIRRVRIRPFSRLSNS